MKARFSLFSILIFVNFFAAAARLEPVLVNDQLGIQITDLTLPDNVPHDLTSGLTNRLWLQVVLLHEDQPRQQRIVEITVNYDLWDEIFHFRVRIDGHAKETRTLQRLEDAMLHLTSPRILTLFSQSELPAKALRLDVEILLDPIERERLRKIRKWVTENSTPTSPDPSGATGSKTVTSAPSNTLFNRIFAEYSAGASLSATWRTRLYSDPFRLGELRDRTK